MCGLFLSTRPEDFNSVQLDNVARQLSNRGPDANGRLESPDVVAIHSRLSIIGLGASGSQPMVSSDGRHVLVYNGEIYNYRDIAKAAGIWTSSDTALLFHLLLKKDFSWLSRLRGMFAFVHFDRWTGTVTALRDPFGIKPLYVLEHPAGGVTLASQMWPLLEHPDARQLSPVGLATFLAEGQTGPTVTLLERVRKLAPGVQYRWVRDKDGRTTNSTRHVPPGSWPSMTLDDALADSVRAHLIADVEVGLFLSSGIDSTLIASYAAEQHPGIRSFTLSFPETPTLDESVLAANNARTIGTTHTTVPVTRMDMASAARRFLDESGEPFGDAAALPLTALSQTVGRDLKVALAGEGADELFGGYARYRVAELEKRMRLCGLPESLVGRLSRQRGPGKRARTIDSLLRGHGFSSYSALLQGEYPAVERALPDQAASARQRRQTEWLMLKTGSRPQYRDYDLACYLPNVLLEKTDRATMAHSLEARVPFLDPVVVSAVPNHSTLLGPTKQALRELLTQRAPGIDVPRGKRGLSVDIESLVRTHFRVQIDRQLGDSGSLLGSHCSPSGREVLARQAQKSPVLAFRLAMLGLWDEAVKGDSLT